MAKLRPAICYRQPKRSYTRISRYREKSFVKGVPGMKIRKFDMGNTKGDYEYMVELITRDSMQIRHNALEAFRMSINRQLEKRLGKNNYHLKIKVYPHQIMRHNPTANFAGADRFSSGMKHCYGKPLGRSAIVKKGQTICYVRANNRDIKDIKASYKIAGQKLPCKYSLEIKELK